MTKLELGIKILEDYNNVKLKDNIKGFDAFRSLMNITLPNKLNEDY